jgi:NADH-quinone oxidoreductase subunit M
MDFLRFLVILLVALPALAAIVAALLGPGRTALIRQICLAITLTDALIALVLAVAFCGGRELAVRSVQGEDRVFLGKNEVTTFHPDIVPGAHGEDVHRTTWTLIDLGPRGAIQFFVGIDGLNIWLIVLTAVLMVASVLISWDSITERTNEYYAWLMALGAGMVGVFLAFDIILFYVFFELTLVPLFFLIGIWGGPERRYASRKFFIYTLAGSLITLLGLLAVVVVVYQRGPDHRFTFSIPDLVEQVRQLSAAGDPESRAFWPRFQFWVFLGMMVGFAIKVPLFPVHTWLPLAHTEAPTAGSVLLAGVLLKLGTYGFIRLTLPLAPEAAFTLGVPLIGTLAVIGISYGAFCARAQDDIKKLVAYSSVSHLGFCMLGMFALNPAGLTGSMLQMINHGLSTGALFLLVGMLYERYHTRQMSDYSGMGARLGLLATAFVFVSLSSVGLPGLNGFVGEALVFFGMFDLNPALAIIGTAGIILGAWYLLTMLRLVFFGSLREPIVEGHEHGDHEHPRDLGGRELATLGPILVLCLLLGVYPKPVIDAMKPEVQIVANILQSRAPGARIASEHPAVEHHPSLALRASDGETR